MVAVSATIACDADTAWFAIPVALDKLTCAELEITPSTFNLYFTLSLVKNREPLSVKSAVVLVLKSVLKSDVV